MAVPSEAILFGALIIVGSIAGLTVGLWTYLNGGQLSTEPSVRDRIDGDELYADDRINELLYANAPTHDSENLDFDPSAVRTTTCVECGSLNRHGYTFCRACGAKLSA